MIIKTLRIPYLLLLCLLLLSGHAQAVTVVSTIQPFHLITQDLAENTSVESKLLITPTESPHHFHLTPSNISTLNQADLIIWGSDNLENFLAKFLKSKASKTLKLSDENSINFIYTKEPCCHSNKNHQKLILDPHFWLDTDNAIVIANLVSQRLKKLSPYDAHQIEKNLEAFSLRTQTLKLQLDEKLASIKGKPFIVLHDAYKYFSKEFDLNIIAIVHLNPELNPSLKSLLELKEKASKDKAFCIFYEPQFPTTYVAKLQNDLNIPSGTLDPLGVDVHKYEDILLNMADSLSVCLQNKS